MRFLMAAWALGLLSAQQDTSPDACLAGIRQKMRENLTHLPDYTCRLTIERSTRAANSRRRHPIDTVHLEVGYVNGKELYAWPGQKFEGRSLDQMMPAGGAVGTGDFALHVKTIFLSNTATFTYAGKSLQEGREAIRFDYRVPQEKSRYLLRSGPQREEVVGYHGSFWADAKTLLLMRLEIAIEEIPPQLRISDAGSTLTYAVTRIGGTDFLLPRSSELFIVAANGAESRNVTRFEQCRQYLGESVVSFAEPASIAAQTPKTVTPVQLPGGLLVEMTLKTVVDGTRAAIGDPITAALSRDAVKAGTVILPKGAKVTGRITRLGQAQVGRILYQVIGLRLSTVEFADHTAEFTGTLESLAMAAAQVSVASADDRRGSNRGGHSLSPGEGIVYVKGNSLHIPSGAHMFWRTTTGSE